MHLHKYTMRALRLFFLDLFKKNTGKTSVMITFDF